MTTSGDQELRCARPETRRPCAARPLGWALAFTLAFAAPAAGRPQPRPMRFAHLTTEMGLSQSTAFCLLQDSQGFVWVGTEDGLNRFDGYAVTTYRHDSHDASSLPSDFVWGIAEDPAGDLWIGTDGGGLARWERKKDRFTAYRHDPKNEASLPSDRVREVFVDRAGFVWVGTRGGGLARLDRGSGRFTRYGHEPGPPSSPGHDEVFAIHQSRSGDIWVGTDGGLHRLDAVKGSYQEYPGGSARQADRNEDKIRAIEEDREGDLWIGTLDGGLIRLRLGTGEVVRHRHDPRKPGSLSDDCVHAIRRDRAGRLWVGTGAGLDLLTSDGEFVGHRRDPRDPTSLADDEVMSLLEDKGGLLWVGTRAGGVSRWDPATWAFGHVPVAPAGGEGLSNGYVTSFAEDQAGRLWVGTMGGGINVFDRSTGEIRHYRRDASRPGGLADDRVMSLLCDRSGDVWAGTMGGGLSRFQPSKGSFRTYREDPSRPGSLSSNGVISLFEDDAGTVWVGTYRGGLDRYDRGTDSFTSYRNVPSDPDSLSGDIVTAIAEGPGGTVLWVGTEGAGLNRLDKSSGRFQRFRHDPENARSLCDDTVYSLHQDQEGSLWIGTRRGLARFDKENPSAGSLLFKSFEERDGLPNKSVYGIRPDGAGHLWLSTNLGLARFDTRSGTFKGYVRSHGLQSNEFNFGAHFRSSRGELFFGGPNGFNAFFAEAIPTSMEPPPVVLTAFLKLNRPEAGGPPPFALDGVRLGYRDHLVTFEFSALDFAAPDRNRYAYKLEGFDKEWIDLGAVHRVTYTSVPPGNHVFRVKAANHDGIWSEKGFALNVRSFPPPWKSGWAYLVYVLLAVSGLAAAYRVQQKRLSRETDYRRRLETEVEARTAELGKKNDELERLNLQLVETSLTDSLTGLRNRRFLFEEVGKEMSLVQRQHKELEQGLRHEVDQLIFIMIDLDWFKPINDTCGHAAGDSLLRQVKGILEKACRSSDVLIRWGGDEFLVVGRVDDLAGVEVIPERVRTMIEEKTFDLGDGQVARLTCSIGFTCYPASSSDLLGLSIDQIVSLADKALYGAKRLGRNAWVGLLGKETTDLGDVLRALDDEPDAVLRTESLAVRHSKEPRGGTSA